MEPSPPLEPAGAPPREAPARAALSFFGVLLLLALPDLLAQSSSRVLGLAWSELFTMLLPAVIAAAGSNLLPSRFLGFHRARALPILMGALLGGAGFLAANGVMALWILLLPGGFLDWFPDVGRIFEGAPLTRALVVGVAVVLAPVCEEAAFRGYLQRTLLGVLRPAGAIVITALLFAARHLDPIRFPALVVLGALFGWLAWRGGSLWPAIAAHAANNALASGIAVIWGGADPGSPRPTALEALAPLLVGSALLTILALVYRRLTPAPAADDVSNPPRRDAADLSTRFRLELVSGRLAATATVGLVALFALLLTSAL